MSKCRVFLVEDDPMVLKVNKDFVEAVPGFAVVGMARDAQNAIAGIKEMLPDLVILDVFMPNCNGIELLRQIRALNIPVDVIMVTAAQDPSTVLTARRFGAFDYLVKPFTFQRLKSALESYWQVRQSVGSKSISQDDIDRMWARAGMSLELTSPKGIQQSTLQKITDYLFGARSKAVTADSLASSLGLSRVTVSRYLDYLTKMGLVVCDLKYDTGGRPKKVYIWTGSNVSNIT